MAGRRAGPHPGQSDRSKAEATSDASGYPRYPQWKIDLFRLRISERRQSYSGQISGRPLRAPGA